MKTTKTILLMGMTLITASGAMAQARINYPKAPRVDTVDYYFGTPVADPYRWLEDDNSAQTAAWVAAENKLTQQYMSRIPFRDKVRKRLTEIANYSKMTAPMKVKGKYYYFANDGLQNQSVLYCRDSRDSQPRMVLDPNTLSKDGTVALQHINFSNDGRYMAYTITRSGSDWNEIYVLDLTTGKTLDDHIVWAKFTDAKWLGDGFFYSGYDAPENALSSINEYHKVYYHRLGTPQSEDYVEYCSDTKPLMFFDASVSDDERYVFITESDGYGNALYVKDLKDRNPHYVKLIGDTKYVNNLVGVDNGLIYVMTNEDAPNCKVITFDAEHPSAASRREFIPEKQDAVLSAIDMANHQFVLTYDRDAASHIFTYDAQGREIKEIELPTFGSVSVSSKKSDPEVFYTFSSFAYPARIYSYNMETGASSLLFAPKSVIKSEDYITEQIFFTSKDGTRVPMFLTYKKGLKRDGQRPVHLYGYGGFAIGLNPGFTYKYVIFPLMDRGGMCVSVNLRGGSEYGEKWHEAGTLMQKQNVFDDFIAAAEWLIANGYTRAGKIACHGASNGGLLVGAVVNQRPDLWGAAIPQVGVMDMLRYHKFTIGWNWAHDYGRSDDSREMFEYLRAYSPLHNIANDGTKYPPILVTSGDHDDRVVPAHSFKYTATLQANNIGNEPHLIRIEANGGHGHSKPISKIIDEATDIQSFILYNLGVKY